MEINEENMLGIAEPEFARAAAEGIEKDFARSREIEPRGLAPATAVSARAREGRDDPDGAVLSGPAPGHPQPPAIAATTVISSPSRTGVAKPLRNRMSSSFR